MLYIMRYTYRIIYIIFMFVRVHIHCKSQSWMLGNYGLTGHFRWMPSYPSVLSLGYSLSSSAPFFRCVARTLVLWVKWWWISLFPLYHPLITHFALSIYFKIPSSFCFLIFNYFYCEILIYTNDILSWCSLASSGHGFIIISRMPVPEKEAETLVAIGLPWTPGQKPRWLPDSITLHVASYPSHVGA